MNYASPLYLPKRRSELPDYKNGQIQAYKDPRLSEYRHASCITYPPIKVSPPCWKTRFVWQAGNYTQVIQVNRTIKYAGSFRLHTRLHAQLSAAEYSKLIIFDPSSRNEANFRKWALHPSRWKTASSGIVTGRQSNEKNVGWSDKCSIDMDRISPSRVPRIQ